MPEGPILLVLDDLMFHSKLEAAAGQAGRPVQRIATAEELAAALASPAWPLVIVDLGWAGGDPIEAVRALRQAAPHGVIIGFYPHVQSGLREVALAAGCTEVLPRSAFVQRLPGLLRAA